jgi:hypothetical protein
MKIRKSEEKRNERYEKGGPWIMPRDISSKGVTTRETDDNNKEHVTLSKLEENVRLILFYELPIHSFETQVPLTLSTTQEICRNKNIIHPRYNGTDTRMSTDLVITTSHKERLIRIAISIKYSHDINNRTVEKMEAEKTYHEIDNTIYWIISEKQIDPIELDNLIKIGDYYEEPDTVYPFVLEEFKTATDRTQTIDELLKQIAKRNQVPKGECIRTFYHLLARKQVRFNYRKKYDLFFELQEHFIS